MLSSSSRNCSKMRRRSSSSMKCVRTTTSSLARKRASFLWAMPRCQKLKPLAYKQSKSYQKKRSRRKESSTKTFFMNWLTSRSHCYLQWKSDRRNCAVKLWSATEWRKRRSSRTRAFLRPTSRACGSRSTLISEIQNATSPFHCSSLIRFSRTSFMRTTGQALGVAHRRRHRWASVATAATLGQRRCRPKEKSSLNW